MAQTQSERERGVGRGTKPLEATPWSLGMVAESLAASAELCLKWQMKAPVTGCLLTRSVGEGCPVTKTTDLNSVANGQEVRK